MAEIEAPVEIELAADEIEITGNVVDAYTIPKEDIEVQAVKNEYTIVGDKLYSSIEASEAPEWLTGIIDTVVGSIVNTKLAELDTAISSIITAIQEIEAVKNQYQELITIAANPDDITISRLETLNSTVADNSAQITNLDTTKTSEAEAIAISANVLDTSIDNGRINSLVTNLNTSISNLDQALSTSITALTSTLGSNYSTITNVLSTSAGEFSAEANAITELVSTSVAENGDVSYSGIIGEMITNTAENVAAVDAGTTAQAYLNNLYAGVQENNFINILGDYVNSGYKYSSTVAINGKTYESGFGLHVTGNGSGTEADPYESEFWINAEKFKFTNTAQSGQVAPFTIDASGTTPQVTFNGVVDFSNTDMSAYDNSNIDTSSLALKDMSNVTTIDGGKITAGSSISAPIINGGVVNGTTINGGTINGGIINGVNIIGSVLKSSWIDMSGSGYLTNWQSVTDINTIDAAYRDNFAKNTDGSYVVDSSGYYRLPKLDKARIDPYFYQVGSFAEDYTLGSINYSGHNCALYSYDSYNVSNSNRVLDASSRIQFASSNFVLLGLRGGAGYNGSSYGHATANIQIGADTYILYGYVKAVNQAADPHYYTTRVTKNNIVIFEVVNTLNARTAYYEDTHVSNGISYTIQISGSLIIVTIVNAINILSNYTIGANILIGECTSYSSNGSGCGISINIPYAEEF